MTINFYLRYHTRFGETLYISGNTNELGVDDPAQRVLMKYVNEEFWSATVEVDNPKDVGELVYRYILLDLDGNAIVETEADRVINLPQYKAKELLVIDTWNYSGEIANAFLTQPFREVLLKNLVPPKKRRKKIKHADNTHEFRVKASVLGKDDAVCISGSAKAMGEWSKEHVILLSRNDNWWTTHLDLHDESFPIAYKYGIYNTVTNTFTRYEDGNNRVLYGDAAKKKITILHDGFIHIPANTWKGAGVAIPVFSLRSRNSFGIGEFNDLKLLVDWAKTVGLKMVQILPVNDTTATHTSADSYPYAAISAFAFHPAYLNLEKLAGNAHTGLIRPLRKKQRQLNELADVDYEQVMKFKNSVVRELFQVMKEEFLDSTDYFEFFELNRHWLVPYAAFCYLRDKHKTADFNQWRNFNVYDEDAIQKLVAVGQKHHDEIAIHYFIQYHLHRQLKEATEYAHRQGVIIKGDIPIGIYRHSVDAWVAPELYFMNEQAGAPPDDFAVKGQNWGFPTYNWKKMREDGYKWWRQRFEQMSNYFDAFRIDHILGFFRIWSIPLHAVEGILGRFVPAIPIHVNEFNSSNIYFDYFRYCRPYITDHIIQSAFGDNASYVRDTFLTAVDGGLYDMKEEFNTQRKVEAYFAGRDDQHLQQGLFDLISNVILIEEEGSQMQQFHFRIGMEQTSSFQSLDGHTQNQLRNLYVDYFYRRQDHHWEIEAMNKLPELKQSTNMLVCGEDLGMVPACVPGVMNRLGILSLEIQRMPKDPTTEFFHPANSPYLAVVTPSTHDMSTIRGWWEEDRAKTQRFYNLQLGHYGEAPYFCEPWIVKEILMQHLYSPAMWSVFQLQDILGFSEKLRKENPHEERINIPADPKHYWRYRMHLFLEDLLKENELNEEFKSYVVAAGR
jgi:4-alpha-glucanotransferase